MRNYKQKRYSLQYKNKSVKGVLSSVFFQQTFNFNAQYAVLNFHHALIFLINVIDILNKMKQNLSIKEVSSRICVIICQ